MILERGTSRSAFCNRYNGAGKAALNPVEPADPEVRAPFWAFQASANILASTPVSAANGPAAASPRLISPTSPGPR